MKKNSTQLLSRKREREIWLRLARRLGGVEAIDLVLRVRLHQVLGPARFGIEADVAPGRPAQVAKMLALAHGQLAHGAVGIRALGVSHASETTPTGRSEALL